MRAGVERTVVLAAAEAVTGATSLEVAVPDTLVALGVAATVGGLAEIREAGPGVTRPADEPDAGGLVSNKAVRSEERKSLGFRADAATDPGAVVRIEFEAGVAGGACAAAGGATEAEGRTGGSGATGAVRVVGAAADAGAWPASTAARSWLGRTNRPRSGAHSKYRFPLTLPSFFPSGVSSSSPTQIPAAKSVTPENRTVPGAPR